MTSQPKFVAIQMGLAKIGVVSSLINSNLTGEVRTEDVVIILANIFYHLKFQSLVHCINVGECSSIIFDQALQSKILDVLDKLVYKDGKEVQVSTLFRANSPEAGDNVPVCNLEEELDNYPSKQTPHVPDLKTQG